MDWLKGMNRVVEYIENNLTQPIDYDVPARIVGCSVYEFSRIFSFMVGMSISEYVRRRRLSQAVFDIQNGGEKITDIALKYCYDSPASFARAFKELHGTTPLSARKTNVSLKHCSPLKFTLSIKGVIEMNYKIVEKPAFTVVAHRLRMWNRYEENIDISGLWLEPGNTSDCDYEILQALANDASDGYLGIYSQQYLGRQDYLIAVESDKVAPPGFINYRVPASRWVIITAEKDAHERAMTEWLPASEFKRAGRRFPVIERHVDKGTAKEIWIPIESEADTKRKHDEAMAELAALEALAPRTAPVDFDPKCLKPHPEARTDVSHDDEGNLVMYVAPECGDGRMGTPQAFTLPLKIEMTAKTDGRNLRIYLSGGRDNFSHGGWLMFNSGRRGPYVLRINDPSCANEHWTEGVDNSIPADEFLDVEWILGERVMAVKVNGEVRWAGCDFEYIEALRDGETISGPIYPATGRGSTVTVKSLRITELQ